MPKTIKHYLFDQSSYLNERKDEHEHGYGHKHDRDRNHDRLWNPSKGVKLPNGGEIRAISDFLEFAGVLPTSSC